MGKVLIRKKKFMKENNWNEPICGKSNSQGSNKEKFFLRETKLVQNGWGGKLDTE